MKRKCCIAGPKHTRDRPPRPERVSPRRSAARAGPVKVIHACRQCCAASPTGTPVQAAYEPAVIEPKWQRLWESEKTFRAVVTPAKAKSTSSTCSRTRRARGSTSANPRATPRPTSSAGSSGLRGFESCTRWGDASGSPRAARDPHRHPSRATTLHKPSTTSGAARAGSASAYDWEREIDTTIRLRAVDAVDLPPALPEGLAFSSPTCPSTGAPHSARCSRTTKVTADGRSEIGGYPIEKLKIAVVAPDHGVRGAPLRARGLDCRDPREADPLDRPERGRGRRLRGRQATTTRRSAVFTTRADTLSGATYVVLAPEHALVARIATPEQRAGGEALREDAQRQSASSAPTRRGEDGRPDGAFAVNPLNGDQLPILGRRLT